METFLTAPDFLSLGGPHGCEPTQTVTAERASVPDEEEVSSKRFSSQTVYVNLIQCTGKVHGSFSREELWTLYRNQGGSDGQLWKPGQLGVSVCDPSTDAIGSWHVKKRVLGITVSVIVFRTGVFKLSLGQGLQAYGCRPCEIEDTCANVLYKLVRRPVETLKINLLSGSKFYGELDSPLDLARFLETQNVYPTLRYPHYHEAGRINVVRAYVSGSKRANIAIDHGGWAHFTGFTSLEQMITSETTFDRLLTAFRTQTKSA